MEPTCRVTLVSGVPYLAGPRPRAISHRGQTPGNVENTIGAFRAALAAGADILESDVHVTRDGVAVLFHDDTLERLTGDPRAISALSWAQLRTIDLGSGEGVPTLEETLSVFPAARFNLDLKSADSPEAACDVVARLGARDRVLLTSFGEKRRRRALRLLPGVASSASAARFLWILLAAKLGVTGLVRLLSRGMCAVQIPVSAAGLKTTTPRFIARLHSAGLEVHFWVINDPAQMQGLLLAGADALITDEIAVARRVIDASEPVS